jgi:hypothetical protein
MDRLIAEMAKFFASRRGFLGWLGKGAAALVGILIGDALTKEAKAQVFGTDVKVTVKDGAGNACGNILVFLCNSCLLHQGGHIGLHPFCSGPNCEFKRTNANGLATFQNEPPRNDYFVCLCSSPNCGTPATGCAPQCEKGAPAPVTFTIPQPARRNPPPVEVAVVLPVCKC